MTPDTFDVDGPSWRTPVTGVTAATDDVRLQPSSYGRGYYRFEGTLGREFFRVRGGRLRARFSSAAQQVALERVERRDPGFALRAAGAEFPIEEAVSAAGE